MKALRRTLSPQFIEKLRAAVRIILPGQQPLEGFVSLSPRCQFHEGPETLLERFNRPDRVIPIQRNGECDVLLINPQDIETVDAMSRSAHELVEPSTFRITHEERVRLHFMSGRQIEGMLRFELPDALNRVSDFLNTDEDFFTLQTTHGVILVNKRRVGATRLYQQSPAPLKLMEGGSHGPRETDPAPDDDSPPEPSA